MELPQGPLTDQQLADYARDGYVVVHGLLTDAEVERFVAYEQEPKPAGWRQDLLHHKDDPVWRYFATHPNVVGGIAQIVGGRPMVVQTMYLEKKPAGEQEVGGSGVALHQDLHYLPCEPATLTACWVAMSDTDAENGGLCVVPGSHKRGLYQTHKNQNAAEHDAWEMDYPMRDRNGREWVEKMYSFEIEDIHPEEIVRLTVPKGAGVFFDGHTIHGSYGNRSRTRYRRAFAIHYLREGSWMNRCDVQDVMPAL